MDIATVLVVINLINTFLGLGGNPIWNHPNLVKITAKLIKKKSLYLHFLSTKNEKSCERTDQRKPNSKTGRCNKLRQFPFYIRFRRPY